MRDYPLVGEMVWQKAAPVLYSNACWTRPRPVFAMTPRFERQMADQVVDRIRRIAGSTAIECIETVAGWSRAS